MSLTNPSPPPESSAVGYEPRDVDWRAVLWTTGVSVAVVTVLMAAVTGMYAALTGGSAAISAHGPPVKLEAAHQLPQWRRQQEERLSTYGWISREDRVVRIPIDRAIDLIAQEQAGP